MQPNNPSGPSANPAPQMPINPEMPQPLGTSSQMPTEIPLGEPTIPVPPGGGGLPPQMPSSPPEVSKPQGSSKKIMFVGIIVVVLIILGIGVYYFYSTMNKPVSEPEVTEAPQSTEELDQLNSELEGVDVTDPEGDLVEVDQEIILLEATPAATTTTTTTTTKTTTPSTGR